MRFLPVFLDLQSGVVLLVGGGDLVRAKLRLLAAAGARIRWFATDGNQDVSGLEAREVARIELAQGDPLDADLVGVIAILCAGAGDVGIAMAARAKAVGLPVRGLEQPLGRGRARGLDQRARNGSRHEEGVPAGHALHLRPLFADAAVFQLVFGLTALAADVHRRIF